MRLTIFALLAFAFSVSASVYSQKTKLSIDVQNRSIKEILFQIENQSGFRFIYESGKINLDKKVSIHAEDQTVDVILKQLFEKEGVKYVVTENNLILINPSGESNGNNATVATSLQGIKRISGVVKDETGEPVVGANVVEKGTMNGTVTDVDGKYSLNIAENATLLISYIGYIPTEIPVRNKSFIVVHLKENTEVLEEVVVVGYGVQKKENLTGAVSAVMGKELTKRPVGQTSLALQGIAPGVTITQGSGQPGQDAGTIRIRGIGTLNDSNPLVLVDGTAMDLNSVDPNIIESVSILKDAASSSIYGSRAANGVILITTKRAQNQEFSVSYNGYAGWQTPTDLPDKVGAIDHMVMLNEAYQNVGRSPLYSDPYIQEYRQNMASDPDHYPNVDWQKAVYNKYAFQQNHFFTLNGGTEKMKLLAAIGYYDQRGITPNTDYNRFTARLNSDIQFTNRFSAKLDMYLKYNTQKTPGRGINDVIYWINRTPSVYPDVLSNGKYAVGWDGDNVLAFAKDGGFAKTKMPSASINMALSYQFTDYLKADVSYTPIYQNNISTTFNKSVKTYYADGELAYTKPGKSALYEHRSWNLSHDFKALVNFDKTFGKHDVKVLAGFQWESGLDDFIDASRDTYIFPQYPKLNAGGSDNQKASGSGSEYALASFFGRINYNYRGKYLLEANIRYDGSSHFDIGHKWGVFPSFSGGWRISEESFWEPLRKVVDNAKLRVSWGQLGNQNIGNYAFASVVSYSSYIIGGQPVTSGAINDMANSTISWEKTEMLDFGIDLQFFSKLSASFDYYNKKTSDILWKLNVPLIIGLNPTYQNAAKVSNKGWDLELRWNDRIADFTYGASFILSDVRNKVIDLKGISMTGLTVNREGYPINSIYGLEATGFISKDDYNADGTYKYATQFGAFALGDIKYKNQNGDDVINNEDEVIIGNTVPRFTYGLNLNAGWKGFDFSMFWQGVGKVDGYLNKQATMPFYWGASALEMHKDHWTETNPNTRFPRLAFNETNNEQNSSFWVANAAYLRLKNVTLGYTLPKKVTDKIKFSHVRLYVSGQNLLSIDNFWDGFDVEAPVGDGAYYPQVKVFTIGLDVKF
ncbi:TonB-dependent receptor [Parabacteroides pacaensis]|uniref:TonB-dependent receptor n=1 Tax=Parabacteroides pacaensis TaxID=2086575 RepID=UPI00131A6D50|nr:TonB-dependent receptor [Parabacteroides pacaensis]